MFGYVTPNSKKLDEQALEEYRAGYCGICRRLNERTGTIGRCMLSYDMTFLYALLTALYEPETERGSARCIVHPAKKQPYAVNEFSDYVADMNFLLGYHKLADNWQDDKNIICGAGTGVLKKRYEKISAERRAQVQVIEHEMKNLHDIETSGVPVEMDAAANCFGRVLGSIFAIRQDMWQGALYEVGAALGRFIYMMDAYEDLPRDEKKGLYNPLAPIASAPDFEQRAYELLTIPMVECTRAFETLPLADGIETLRNILYAGVWSRFEMIHAKRTQPAKGKKTES